MKKLLLVLIILLNLEATFGQDFTFPAEFDYPQIEKHGQKVEDFVPKSWKIIGKAGGDLNGDKIADSALVLKGNDAKSLNKNDGLGNPEYDTNPRMLIVLFKNTSENRYEIAEQSNSFILIPDSPTMTEPFKSVKIKNGALWLDFEQWYSAGSWGTTEASYKFKYSNGEFVLIGADKTESMRNTGDTETRSYNFLINRMSITTGNFAGKAKPKTRWKTFKVKETKTFRTFKEPFSWEIEPDYFL
jgi:hypothetical protein